MLNCNAKYGHIERHPLIDLQSYANANIRVSFEFLLMSSYFGNYEDQRHGFKKLYRKFSDELWEDAINIIKYVTKRGDTMDFNQPPHLTEPVCCSLHFIIHILYNIKRDKDVKIC